jgi:hypothetical protein
MAEIEKNVPPPKEGRRPPGSLAPPYPFSKMEPGDSVFIRGGHSDGLEASAARQLAFKRRRKGAPCRFVARNVEGGVRIWRVE